ncbi:MAG: NAD-dependent epimerase/dehydratase family protein [Gemmatimonadota bacterium]
MRVFITGATGLLGHHIAERLRAGGHEVAALVRPTSDRGALDRRGVRCVVGDLLEPASYRGALAGCDALVHAAAFVVEPAGWTAYHRMNVEATRHLFEAAAAAGVERALHLSTVAVYGGVGRPGAPVTEETPTDRPVPEHDVYARSKRKAEEVVFELHRAGALDVRVVRPILNYGERDRIVLPRVVHYVRSPVVFLVGSGTYRLAVTYAANTAEGAVLALTRPEASGRVYNLADDFPITQKEFLSRFAAGLDRDPIFLPLPYAVAYALAWVVEMLPGRISTASGLNRRRVSLAGRPNPFSAERARRELGWAPSVPHEEAIRRSVEWYRADGRKRGRGGHA